MSGISRANLPVAVVAGLDCITGLQTARILSSRGVRVVGVARDPKHFCCRTRRVQAVHAAEAGEEGMVRALEAVGRAMPRRGVLFPCTDADVLAVAHHRKRLEPWFHVMLPATDTLERLLDKTSFHAFASAEGLPLPRTVELRSRADAKAAGDDLTFPVVLKPSLRTALWEARSKTKVIRAATSADLLEAWDRCSSWTDALVAQEWIEGPDSELYSCNGYFDTSSEPLVTFVARKLRQWPPHAGTSSLGEECRNDEVRDLTLRLFRAAGFSGLVYLEVKRHIRTGRHYLIEANVGRPTGRSAIAEAGGVELLYTMYCDAVGLPLPDNREQHDSGAKWIFWRQDVRSAFHEWREGELSLAQWASSWRGRKSAAVLSWSDPMPFLMDLVRIPRRLSKGGSGTGVPVSTSAPAVHAAHPAHPAHAAHAAPAMRAASASTTAPLRFDYDLRGVLGIRLIDPTPADRAAVEAQLGAPRGALEREPDITLRFVKRLPLSDLEFVEVNRSGFTNEGFFVRGKGRRAAWCRVPFDAMGSPCEFLCESGVGPVPLLKPALRIAALGKGYLPFHASAFEWNGSGVVVTGWSHGGKTSALLAFAEQGARYLGDDLVFLPTDGGKMFGLPAPMRLSAWHLSELPRLGRLATRRRRLLLSALGAMGGEDGLRSGTARGERGTPYAARKVARKVRERLRVEFPLDTVFPAGCGRAAVPRTLFLMMSATGRATTVDRVDPLQVAERMDHSLHFEDLSFRAQYLAYRFAFPDRCNSSIDDARAVEATLLRRALADMDAYVVRHPYPAPFRDLHAAMLPWCSTTGAEHDVPMRSERLVAG